MAKPSTINYAGKPIHWVTVQVVKPGRLKVVNEDGKIGIIPEREWSWDRSMNRELLLFTEGQPIEAVYLEERSRPGLSHYSIAQLKDPWEGAEKWFKKGNVVTGEVVNLRDFGAFVQLKPGITAIVRNRDLPLSVQEIPSDQLVLGDKLRGVITGLDIKSQKIDLDVNLYLEQQANEELEVHAQNLKKLFQSSIKAHDEVANIASEATPTAELSTIRIQPLQNLKAALVVDDLEDHRINIKKRLEETYQAEVETASDFLEAMQKFGNGQKFDLVILDFTLTNGPSGIQIAQALLEINAHVKIILYSYSSQIEGYELLEALEQKFNVDIPIEIKQMPDCQSLIECIDNFRRGYKTRPLELKNNASFAKDFGKNTPLKESIQDMVGSLVKENKLEHGFVLELNLAKKLSLIVHYSRQTPTIDLPLDLDALYFSPIRQIIEDNEDFYMHDISVFEEMDSGRLKNFFPNFSFRACFGIPIPLTGQNNRYALLVLEQEKGVIDKNLREKILRISLGIGTAIERAATLDLLWKFQSHYYKGQLLGSFVHELSNKLSPMQRNIQKSIENLNNDNPIKALSKLLKLKNELESLNRLFNSYVRLARNNAEMIQLNEIVEKVYLQQKTFAKESYVEILLDLTDDLPEVQGNFLQNEQILANLLLNAIQQINEQLGQIQLINRQHRNLSNLSSGTVVIRSVYQPQRKICRIEIIDSGPGVPFNQWESIFGWGMSTRKDGQGMGLYISKSLTEALGGQLLLLDSIRFIGSLFIIEFPINN